MSSLLNIIAQSNGRYSIEANDDVRTRTDDG